MLMAGLIFNFIGAIAMGLAAFQFAALEQADLETFPENKPLGDRQKDSAIKSLEKTVKDIIENNKVRASKQRKANCINFFGIVVLTIGFILQLLIPNCG